MNTFDMYTIALTAVAVYTIMLHQELELEGAVLKRSPADFAVVELPLDAELGADCFTPADLNRYYTHSSVRTLHTFTSRFRCAFLHMFQYPVIMTKHLCSCAKC
jgi:hypothetical protein